MRTKIRVFPDFMSSGLWKEERGSASVEANDFAHYLPKHLLIALSYWHLAWEQSWHWDEGTDDFVCSLSDSMKIQWEQDGITLVMAMNAVQDEFEFVYVGGNF